LINMLFLVIDNFYFIFINEENIFNLTPYFFVSVH
jgi:hypothetical protein